jgi:MoxR-like ATPase
MATTDPSTGASSNSDSTGGAVRIQGHAILFPDGRKPFPAQLAVISKVLQALKEKKNALLESPTGTGKVRRLLSLI